MTAGQVAKKMGATAETVRDWIARGLIRAQKCGRVWHISPDEFNRFMGTIRQEAKEQ
jgi:excisionase family DNA binding protein